MRLARRTIVVLLMLLMTATPPALITATGSSDPSGSDRHTRPGTEDIEEGLEQGDSGDGVVVLQEYLDKYGYMNLRAYTRGTFDRATARALRDFQSVYQLLPTGWVDRPTLDLINTPRYDDRPDIGTNGDPELDYFVLIGTSWDDPNLTYAFDEYSRDLNQTSQRAAFNAALASWSAVSPLEFTEVAMNQSPEIVISFGSGSHGDNYPFDGPGNVLAHAFYPPSTDPPGATLHGDAHFDDAETWTVSIPVPGGGIDLQTVALHEFGHSLGLGHSDNEDAIMYAYYGGANRALHSDDIAGIQTLYGSNGGGSTVDAEVLSVSASPSSIEQNSGNVTVSATIQNNGTSTATIPINATGPNNWTASESRSLSSGSSTTVQFDWPATVIGTHDFTVSTALNGDQNAANNSQTTNSVTVTAPDPDEALYVAGIDITATPNSSGHLLQAIVTVGPNAEIASEALLYAYWLNPQNQYQIVGAYVNGAGTATFQYSTTVTGNHRFIVYRVRKTGYQYDSSLNVGNPASIDVGGGSSPTIDAAVNSVTVNPSTIAVNSGNVTITATIGNNGDNSATIPVSITGPGNFSDSQSVNVAAGGTQAIAFTWPADQLGIHTFSVSTSLAGDSNSSNNSRAATVSVTNPDPPAGDRLYISRIYALKYGPNWFIYTWVESTDGQNPTGAIVTATIRAESGQSKQVTGTMRSRGYALMYVSPVAPGPNTYTVDDVTFSGYTYDPSLNVVTSMDLPT